MTDYAIRCEGLSKQYRRGQRESYKSLRETLTDAMSAPVRRLCSAINGGADAVLASGDDITFWALKNVSFEVKQGEVIGIIGRNGAGKSTLLRILSRITKPTSGEAQINGRVGSLLEVGTGFHPELTGRENMYLNGAIIGMKKQEIERKFDQIVAFAEVEKFLDTPVKRYSSGMYVRLAFSVAAHLEPEVLIVDEVLAVGDAAFQKKCLGKISDVVEEGRTVLFVSHDLAAVHSLCAKALVLDYGKIKFEGNTADAIYRFQDTLNSINFDGVGGVQVLALKALSDTGGYTLTTDTGMIAEAHISTERTLPNCYLNFIIKDDEGRCILHARTDLAGIKNPTFEPGVHRVNVKIPKLCIRAGVYSLWFSLYINSEDVIESVSSSPIMIDVKGQQEGGIVQVPCYWSWEKT